ncbi:MAG: PKD domain-containing protein, partial [Planctomycetota bacterium]|nr:PKD domain-containing protein [Planctomycetota bacterium]
MTRLTLASLCLWCAVFLLTGHASAEEPGFDRVRLSIVARDPAGGKLTFSWKQVPNEAPAVKIADPNAARFENGKWTSETYFIPKEPGKYVFEVTVKNEAGDESKKLIQQEVLAPAAPPVAVAGKDQDGAKVGEIVTINGVASKAAEGRAITEWDWRVVKTPEGFKLDAKQLKDRSFEFRAEEPGSYQFELRVSDGKRWSEPSRTTVTVQASTPPPVAVAGKDQTRNVGDTVRLDGSDSKAAPGQTVTEWEWKVVQAPEGFKPDPKSLKERVVEFKPDAPGVYQFELRVSDGKRQSEPARTTVTVQAPVPPPVAVAGKDQTRTAGDTVRLDGSDSKAAAGQTIAEWEWKVVEAPEGFKPDPKSLKERVLEFKPEAPGAYAFELRVFDGKRQSEPSRTTVTVQAPVPPPVAVAGKDQTKTVGEVVRLNSVDSKAAPGQTITEWEWKVVQAPEGSKLDAKALKERALDFKAEKPGEYQFELRVSDGKRWSEPSKVSVKITPGLPPNIETPDVAAPVELPPKPPVVDVKKPEVRPVVVPGEKIKLGETIVLDGSKSVVDEALNPEFLWTQEPTKAPFAKQLAADKSRPFSKARLSDPLNYPVWTCRPEQPGEYKFVLEIGTRGATADAAAVKTKGEPVVFTVVGAAAENPPPPDTKGETPPAAAVNLPVARIFAERRQVEVGAMVKLDGSKSTGVGDGKLEYIWGPVPGKRYPKTWSGTDGPLVQFKAEEEGEYVVALMVKDTTAKTFSEQALVTITVGAANRAPVVKLAKSFECVVGEQLRVEAEASDPDNDRLEYQWVCLDPPDLAILPERLAKNSILIFKPRTTGTYCFKVTVTDAKGASDSAQTMIGVKDALNRPPTAIIDGPKKRVGIGAKIKLSGERSSDPEGKAVTCFWKQESGPKVATAVPGERDKVWEFTASEAGTYVFSLVVSDGVNKSDPDRLELVVSKENNPPAAHIVGPPGGRIAIGEKATLDGSTSSDPDPNDKLTYKWRKAEPPEAVRSKREPKSGDIALTDAEQERATVKGVSPGPVRVELVVNDGTVDSDPAILDLVVVRPNNPPVAKIAGPTAAKVGAPVELSGEESSDPDGDPITYEWSQPADGGPDIGVHGRDLRKKTLRFKAERSGTYVISLRVIDSEGLKSEPAIHKVEVKGANRPPIAAAELVGTDTVTVGAEVKLTGRRSRDPEGAPLTYKWKQVSGPPLAPFVAAEGGVNNEIVNVAPAVAGTYVVELVVNDGDNDSVPAAVSFTAKAPHTLPVAVIGDVVPCEPGERTVLDGSASHGEEGRKLEYRWRQVSGPDAKVRNSGKARAEVTLNKEGEYVFELKVFDGKEWSEPREVSVKTRLANVPPVAAFAVPDVRTEEDAETVLDASASTDPDKGPRALTYAWKQINGPKADFTHSAPTDPTVKFTPKKTGALAFQVKVSDGKTESAPAEVRVEVLKKGTLPVAIATATPNPLKAAQKGDKNDLNILILDGTKSRPGAAVAATAGGRNVLVYQWKQAGGEDLKLRPADLVKDRIGLRIFRPGAYRFVLIVSDGQNRSAPASVDVQVVDTTSAPATEAPKPKTDAPAPLPPPPPGEK